MRSRCSDCWRSWRTWTTCRRSTPTPSSPRRPLPPSAPDPLPLSGRRDGDAAAAPVVVLGVDPGLRVTGFGVVRVSGTALDLLGYDVIRPVGDITNRLADIHAGLCRVIGEHSAAEMAIEQP